MDKSTKKEFYRFLDRVLIDIPPPPPNKPLVTTSGELKDVFENLDEYEENMQLRIVLTIIRALTEEGKLQEVYWLLRNRYLETLQ